MYVDVHCHLTHDQFAADSEQVIAQAQAKGLGAIVVNGLEPKSNRRILELAKKYSVVQPALGIYPIDAVNAILPADFPHVVEKFDVWQEVAFIREQAAADTIIAIGECGLDGYWLTADSFPLQEKVFTQLIEISLTTHKPLIVHSRKCELRTMEMLAHYQVQRVNFHCFGGKTKKAQEGAEKFGWWFSIPANANVNEAFAKMLKILPFEKILTETDAPYLSPVRGTRNEPANVVGTVELLAKARGVSLAIARERVWQNYLDLFTTKS